MVNLFTAGSLLLVASVLSQAAPTPNPPPSNQVQGAIDAFSRDFKGAKRFSDPYEAYAAGAYDQALQGFVDQQVEHPDDAELMLNIGNTHYEMGNFEEAAKSFETASLQQGDKALRTEALYNYGNTLFRQGKLEESVKAYQSVLELNPDDQDAKYNIEYVRDEIRRRIEENKKRQEQQQNQNQQGEQNKENQSQQNQGDNEQNQEQQEGQQDQGDQGQAKDSDQDGLGDEAEKSAANPTDPNNPDSDGDGLPDGEEDANRNGKVDKGETDPNKKDTDGNGKSDAEDKAQGAKQGQAQEAKPSEGLSKEEAERYLNSLGPEQQPKRHQRGQRGRRSRVEKDW